MTDDNITYGEYLIMSRSVAAMAPNPREAVAWMEHVEALESQLDYLNRCLDLPAHEPERSL